MVERMTPSWLMILILRVLLEGRFYVYPREDLEVGLTFG